MGDKGSVPAIEASIWQDEQHGPLPALLLTLTIVTGVVDAVSFLKLGHVFVANMTGNVVFLGFAIVGATDLSILASLSAIVVFLSGALAGGWLALHAGHHRGRLLAIALYIEIALVGAAFIVSMVALDPGDIRVRYVLIVLLAVAMGLQTAAAHRLAVPDLTTTVLTSTLAAFAADSALPGGTTGISTRRPIAAGAMFLGAALGAALVVRVGVGAALALALALLVGNGIVAYRLSSSMEAWTVRARA